MRTIIKAARNVSLSDVAGVLCIVVISFGVLAF